MGRHGGTPPAQGTSWADVDFFGSATVVHPSASAVAAAPAAAVSAYQRWPAPPPAPVTPAPQPPPKSESGLPLRLGVVATVMALLASIAYQVTAPKFVHRGGVIDTNLRRILVVTVGFYVLVGLALLVFVLRTRTRLVWHRDGAASALLLGLPLGLGGGILGVAVNSAASGHLASDPNITALVGGGGAARLFLTFVTVSVLAPLTEEVIFRGICAGSLLARGTAHALWGSAIAFAVWHCNPNALRYYAVMGLVIAWIWMKRGLLASMAAHAAFNGVLAVAAVAATSGAATYTTFDRVAVQIPGGWHVDELATGPSDLLVRGPSGAELGVLALPQSPRELSLSTFEDRLATTAAGAGFSVDRSSIVETTTPLGDGVEAEFTVANQPAHILVFAYDDRLYAVVMVTAGNPAAEREWDGIVDTLHPA